MPENPETGCCCSTHATIIFIAVLNVIVSIGLGMGCMYLILGIKQEIERGETISSSTLWICMCIVIGCCINLIVSILMWIGTVQHNPKRSLSWLYYNYLLFALECIGILYFCVMMTGKSAVLFAHLYMYWWMVSIVRNYTKTIRGGGGRGTANSNYIIRFQSAQSRVFISPMYNNEGQQQQQLSRIYIVGK